MSRTAPKTNRNADRLTQFHSKGWCRFPFDPVLADWLEATLPAARAAVTAPEHRQWLRYQGTWFAGVNAPPNDATGAVPGGPPLAGQAVDFIARELGLPRIRWDKAQVSVCYPGYPQPMEDESEAVFRFRRDRDAAHVDGLLKEGPDRRRYLREHHAFILGIPMADYSEGAAPFTVWEGSHHLVGAAFRAFFGDMPPEKWGTKDVTDMYQTVRREAFDSCPRIPLHAAPGECYLVHRHAVHGMAPWQDDAVAGEDGRAILYFRPETEDRAEWLSAD